MAYIFDFFGVISSGVADFWFSKYLPNHSIADLRSKYLDDVDLGKLPLSTFHNELARLTNQSSEEIAKQWRELTIINQEVVCVVKRLRSRDKIALCSNAPADFIRPIMKEHQLESLFDVIVISGEVGMIKPNDDIFKLTLNLLGTKASQTTFIDDRKENIDAARVLGMKCILYEDITSIISL